jgi:hypothetical protein
VIGLPIFEYEVAFLAYRAARSDLPGPGTPRQHRRSPGGCTHTRTHAQAQGFKNVGGGRGGGRGRGGVMWLPYIMGHHLGGRYDHQVGRGSYSITLWHWRPIHSGAQQFDMVCRGRGGRGEGGECRANCCRVRGARRTSGAAAASGNPLALPGNRGVAFWPRHVEINDAAVASNSKLVLVNAVRRMAPLVGNHCSFQSVSQPAPDDRFPLFRRLGIVPKAGRNPCCAFAIA